MSAITWAAAFVYRACPGDKCHTLRTGIKEGSAWLPDCSALHHIPEPQEIWVPAHPHSVLRRAHGAFCPMAERALCLWEEAQVADEGPTLLHIQGRLSGGAKFLFLFSR